MIRLDEVKSPRDLKGRSVQELTSLAGEIRERIIETVSRNGGHLGASLGAVELTLALHSVFDSPRDKIIWDVGHQAYAHKLVTGRYDKFGTLRKLGGLSGFPKRSESPHDIFDAGHASNSVSVALGLAIARDRAGEDYNVIAVIGDGALTGGLAFEGLNNAGRSGTKIIVVLNDNSMSISRNVGGISHYLTRLRMARSYTRAKARFERALLELPRFGPSFLAFLKRFRGGIKYVFFPGTWFEDLGFKYYGPVDGHDIGAMQEVFSRAREMDRPVLIHVITKKGKGYPLAESFPEKFHGPGPFDVETGELYSSGNIPTWSEVFGEAMVEIAEKDPAVVAITAAMKDGTGLSEFARRFPERFFDVGIAEGHAVSFAAGLALGGMKPVVAIYSTFLQRAYDQIVEDVCLQNLGVVFAVDRAGVVGEDGETHQGAFDLSYLRHIPGMTVMAPADEMELKDMLRTALEMGRPVAIRYPRGKAYGGKPREARLLPVGRAQVLVEGSDVTIFAIGSMVYPSVEAAKILERSGVSCGVVNARFVKPLDVETLLSAARKGPVVTVEENVPEGGFGGAVLEALSQAGVTCQVLRIAMPSRFLEHGAQSVLRERCGLTAEGIAREILRFLGQSVSAEAVSTGQGA
ncbi:MAG: 1-deoxy-D-xylulose-5-phosphate synthase [Firmicutes bacterium]|nr:1-deoxy-D-xylulose-5-phosphate synthase [Candidatus Fermentithermobacillaceae bacterium]